MADDFSKVSPGQPLNGFPAAVYNAMLECIADLRSRRLGVGGAAAGGDLRQSSLVRVRNDSGADRDQFDVLGLDVPLVLPADNEDEFRARATFSGITPAWDDHRGRFALLLEPLKSGAVGWACLAGVCPAAVIVDDEATERHAAEVIDGDCLALQAVHDGSATILWREGGTGLQWAVVRLGPRRPATVFPVALTQTGGAQGDESTAATWTYDVADALTGEALAAAVDPTAAPHNWQRPGAGQMIAATKGTAHWNKDDELVLDWLNEQVDQEACNAGGA